MIDFLIQHLTRRRFVIACFASLTIRVAWTVVASPPINTIEDWSIAQNLSQGNGYSLYDASLGPTAMKAPVYPLFLLANLKLFGSSASSIIVLCQHLFVVCTAWFIYRSARLVYQEWIAIATATAFLLHPSFAIYPFTLESTNLTVLISAIFLERFCRMAASGWKWSLTDSLVYGIVSALLILCQPVFLPVVILTLGFVAFRASSNRISVFVVFVAVMIPWTTRNAIVFEKFIPLKSPVWMNFYLGYTVKDGGFKEFATLGDSTIATIDSLRGVLNDIEMEPHYRKVFLEEVSSRPLNYVFKTMAQAVAFWTVPARYRESLFSPAFLFGRLIPALVLNLLSLWWAINVFRRRKPTELELLIFGSLALFTLTYALTACGNVRYKLDVEWMQVFGVGVLLSVLVSRLKNNVNAAFPTVTHTG